MIYLSYEDYALHRRCPYAYHLKTLRPEIGPTERERAKEIFNRTVTDTFHGGIPVGLATFQRLLKESGLSRERLIRLIAAVNLAVPIFAEIKAESTGKVFCRSAGDIVLSMAVPATTTSSHGNVTLAWRYGSRGSTEGDLSKATYYTALIAVTGIASVRVLQFVGVGRNARRMENEAVRTTKDLNLFVEDVIQTGDSIAAKVFPKAPLDDFRCSSEHCRYWSVCRGS